MVASVVAKAIEMRLAGAVDIPVIGVNLVGAAPVDGSPWVLVQYPLTNARGASVGDPGANIWRDEGAARVVINVEAGAGTAQALALSDQIVTLFRGWQSGRLTCHAPVGGPIDDRNDVGGYWQTTVVIPYDYDALG